MHYNFLKVMGIEVTEGRDFRQEDANSERGILIFNEVACKKFDMELSEMNVGLANLIRNIHLKSVFW